MRYIFTTDFALQIEAERNTAELRDIMDKCIDGMGPFHPILMKGLTSSQGAYIEDTNASDEIQIYCCGREFAPFLVSILDDVLAHNHAETAAAGEWQCEQRVASEAQQEAAMQVAKERFGGGDCRGALRVWRWAVHQGQLAAEAPHKVTGDGAGDAVFLRDTWLSVLRQPRGASGTQVRLDRSPCNHASMPMTVPVTVVVIMTMTKNLNMTMRLALLQPIRSQSLPSQDLKYATGSCAWHQFVQSV